MPKLPSSTRPWRGKGSAHKVTYSHSEAYTHRMSLARYETATAQKSKSRGALAALPPLCHKASQGLPRLSWAECLSRRQLKLSFGDKREVSHREGTHEQAIAHRRWSSSALCPRTFI